MDCFKFLAALAFSVIFFFTSQSLRAQCLGNAQLESWTCFTTPATLNAPNPCGNCTYTWNPAPTSGAGTAVAQYQYPACYGFGTAVSMVHCDTYNPNLNCTSTNIWQVGYSCQPNLALPVLSNGPWNGDTSKVWIYTRTYLNPTVLSYVGDFLSSWSVTGGAIQRTRRMNPSVNWTDSVMVKWNGVGTMSLTESQMTHHFPHNMMSDFWCNWTPTTAVVPLPPLGIFYNNAICIGAPKNFFTFPYPGSTYTWSVSNGTVVSGQGSNSAQIIINGSGTVSLTRDSSGVLSSTTINVNPYTPSINLGPDRDLCSGTNTSLDAGPGFSNYAWSTGANSQITTVTTGGTYSVTASIGGGCIASDTIVITSIPSPTVNLGPNLNLCSFPTNLDAGPGAFSYLWSNGATTQSIQAIAGGYYVVTATGVNGCTATDDIYVTDRQTTINLPPTMSYCHPGNMVISPSYTNAGIYSWSTGATTASVTLNSPGSTILSVHASNIYGCSADDTVTITSLPRPTPSLGPDIAVCPGTPATFTPGPGYASYVWSPYATTQSITVTNPNSYRVTVTGSNGCTGSDTVQLLNYPVTPANLGPNIFVCQSTATLNPGAGYATYAWSTGATTPTLTVGASGTYSVTVTTSNGCTSTDAILVTFNNFTLSLGPDQVVCEPQVVTLNPGLSGNYTYNWSTGSTNPTVSLSIPGTHTITLSATNGYSCSDSDTVVVTVLPAMDIDLGPDSVICRDTFYVADAGPGFTSYLWNNGATTQSLNLTGGQYWVEATNSNGCLSKDTISLSTLIDCTFPGDVNYDLVADFMDALALGNAMGRTGSGRNNPSTNWYGQWTANWGTSVMSGVNSKQADTDGNGIVNLLDTLAIQQNYSLVHSKVGQVSGGNRTLRISPLSGAVTAGDTAYFGMYYEGPTGGVIDSVHGLAMHLSWPSNLLTGPGLLAVDWSNAWFAPAGNRLTLHRFGQGQADLVISRTDQVDTAGFGLIGTLAFLTDPLVAPGSFNTFMPEATWLEGVGTSMVPQGPGSVSLGIVVLGATSVGSTLASKVSVWPNPTSDRLRIVSEGQPPVRIQLLNLLGQVVSESGGDGELQHVIDVQNLPNGSYRLQVQFEGGVVGKTIVVAR